MMKVLSLDQIQKDEELYPRTRTDWQTILRYADSLSSGSVFPPVLVAQKEGKYILLDGYHRYEAHKKCKKVHIQAEVKENLTETEMYLLAVEANTKHGEALSPYERALAIKKLFELGVTPEDISKTVRIPVGKLKGFVEGRSIKDSFGNPVIVKAPLKGLSELPPISENDQDVFAARSQYQIINQLIQLVDNNMLDISNEKLKAKVQELYSKLSKYS